MIFKRGREEMKDLNRYREVMREIRVLVEEGYGLLSEGEKLKARGSWYVSILSSIDRDHYFLSRCVYTMEDSMRGDVG